MIDTILFDLGNVLFPFDWEIAVRGFAAKLSRDPADVRRALSHPDYAILFYEFGTGRISVDRFHRRINEVLRAEMDLEGLTGIWCSIFREDRGMLEMLKSLAKGRRVFILSDTDILHWSFLNERYGLEGLIRGAVLSFRRGCIKTDKGTFENIVRDYRLDPERTVFIDDLEKNVRLAEGAGMRGVIHRGFQQTRAELAKLGVTA
jgi:putative hydrolase of the HAD superfamily